MNNFNKLKKWLNKDKDNLRMFNKESRGIYSIKDIKSGERILEIPEKYMLEFSKIDNTKLSNKLYNTNSYVAYYLLLESLKKKSYWKIYLDTLPTILDEYIYYYDKVKLSQLKNTSMMCSKTYNYTEHIKNIKKDSKIIYKWFIKNDINNNMLINNKINNEKDFFELFLKFRIYICSRIFGYDKKNNIECGMIPYADLFNHSENSNTTWYYDDNKKVFVVEAIKNIKKNHEIYDTYGDKTNIELILYYGFSIKNNKYSELNFILNNNLITLNYNNKNFIIDEKIKKKIKKILEHHIKKIESGEITDNNILNIYNDEINIINHHLL